jgi:hypothetical protein
MIKEKKLKGFLFHCWPIHPSIYFTVDCTVAFLQVTGLLSWWIVIIRPFYWIIKECFCWEELSLLNYRWSLSPSIFCLGPPGECRDISLSTCHRYLMSRLSLQVFYLWRHVSSTAPPLILWWSNLEILVGPLHRNSPFIGELRCQAIQTEHGPYITERTQKAVYIVRCLWYMYGHQE